MSDQPLTPAELSRLDPELRASISALEDTFARYERLMDPTRRFLDHCTEEEFRAWQRGAKP